MSTVDSFVHVFHEGEPGTPVALLLHGTGADEHDLVPLGKALLPGSPILSPRGRVNEHGMNRWFKRLGEGVFDIDDVIAQASDLASFVTDAVSHYGLSDRPIVAAGFSNGANMATATALLHKDVLNTVIALSGMFPFGDRDPIGDVSGVRVFMANGDADPMAPLASGAHLEALGIEHGAAVTRFVRPGGHGITHEDLAQASAWLGL